MRDSALKRALVSAWFSGREVLHALTGAVGPARFSGRAIDYELYWQERLHGGLHPRFLIIEPRIAPGTRVLDVGCGDGLLLRYLRECKQIHGVGVDVSATAVARARASGVDARVGSLGSSGAIGPAETFDHVILSEVIEHVADAEGMVRLAWAATAGTLWLTFPNIAYFPHRLRLALGRFPVQWVVFPGEHLRFWSLSDFREWLASVDLPPPEILPSNGLTVGGLHRLWPNLFANQIVVRIMRADA